MGPALNRFGSMGPQSAARASDVHSPHPTLGVAGAGGAADRDRRRDAVDFGRGQMDPHRA